MHIANTAVMLSGGHKQEAMHAHDPCLTHNCTKARKTNSCANTLRLRQHYKQLRVHDIS
jgi:hypothetical protein